MRRLFIAALLGSFAALALPTTGGAIITQLIIELESTTSPLTFSIVFPTVTCDAGTMSVDTVYDGNHDEVAPISFTLDPTDPNAGTLVLPDATVAGVLSVEARCLVGDQVAVTVGSLDWGSLAVTKVVEGAVPEDTTFRVSADCELSSILEVSYDAGAANVPLDFVVDLSYPAAGGVGHVYTDHPTVCALTEPENGGAISTTIDPELVTDLEDPGSTSATVTNVFPAALPIVIQPTFTG